MKKLLVLMIILSLFVSACKKSKNKKVTQTKVEYVGEKEPVWVFNPGDNGKYKFAGVGISARSLKGPQHQRQLAIQRALDEIARQMGTTIDTQTVTKTKGSSTGAKTSLETYSVHTTNGQKVTAVIRQFWRKESTNELYVWMTTID